MDNTDGDGDGGKDEREAVADEHDDGDDWSDSADEVSHPVFLGFAVPGDQPAEPVADGEVASQIGGLPHWLRHDSALELNCPGCGDPYPLLAQVYAPLDWIEAAFHRVLYVFCCPKVSCWSASRQTCVRVLRCQTRESERVVAPEHTCRVCGKPATKACSQCRQRVWYCGKHHQVADWKAGHKARCAADVADTEERLFGPRFVYKKLWVETEQEHIDGSAATDAAPASVPEADTAASDSSSAAVAPSQLVQHAFGPDVAAPVESLMAQLDKPDADTLRFQARTAPDPDQVLRYSFGARHVLWVHAGSQMVGDPPPCESCGGQRVFELQLMPQLLYYLDLEAAGEETAMDWATIVVYACENSCTPANGSSFVQEFAYAQDVARK